MSSNQQFYSVPNETEHCECTEKPTPDPWQAHQVKDQCDLTPIEVIYHCNVIRKKKQSYYILPSPPHNIHTRKYCLC